MQIRYGSKLVLADPDGERVHEFLNIPYKDKFPLAAETQKTSHASEKMVRYFSLQEKVAMKGTAKKKKR